MKKLIIFYTWSGTFWFKYSSASGTMSILEMLLVWQNWLSSSKLIVSALVDVPLRIDTSY